MKQFWALVLMQLKDKLNVSYTFKGKAFVKSIIPFLAKIVIIAAISTIFFQLCGRFSIFSLYSIVPLVALSVFLALLIILSTFSCTIDLARDLFLSDDNKVLVTYPVSGGKIFLSKIFVYYLSEFYRSITITMPIVLGYGISVGIGIGFYFWMPISFIFVSAIPVVLGMFLSIPVFYVLRLLNTYKPVKIAFTILLIGAAVTLAVYLISLLPSSLNLVYLWPRIYRAIQAFLAWFKIYFGLFYTLSIMIVGMPVGTSFTYANIECWLTLIYLIVGIAALMSLMYFAIKPFFISMTSKSFEKTKSEAIEFNRNNTQGVGTFLSCVNKEFKLLTRDSSYIAGLLGTYILTPVVLLLLISIFKALSIGYNGTLMAYAFSLLISILPVFASNGIISTIFSQEGRAGYIKKTQPLNPFIPLTAKLVIPLGLSLMSLLVSMGVFATFALAKFSYLDFTLLTLSILLFQVGLVFYAAYNDISNPKNQEYATTGESFNNPNEIKTTIVAFILSAVIAVYFYVLMYENENNFIWVGLKLFIWSVIFFGFMLTMYIVYIRSSYIDNDERR